VAQCNGRTVFEAETGTSISKDPFISFKFKNGNKGDKVVVSWNDNKGDSRTDEVVIT
jgi:sulfur-oxidizing protein SoxZ